MERIKLLLEVELFHNIFKLCINILLSNVSCMVH